MAPEKEEERNRNEGGETDQKDADPNAAGASLEDLAKRRDFSGIVLALEVFTRFAIRPHIGWTGVGDAVFTFGYARNP